VFFSVTKLFQSKDQNLRRMVYLIIKEVLPSSDEAIIVTSSLMKDMNSKTDLYRANAIRVLCNIIDAGMLTQIERYLKQAVVDKNAVVASSALVSGLHLLAVSSDVVRRWSGEVTEAVSSRHPLVQFHALALSHAIRAGDRLAASKLVSGLTRAGARAPLAQCLLVRFTARVIAESTAREGEPRPFFDFLESCLRHKNEMVIFEAARAIADMNDVAPRELAPAVTVLQLFLSSSKPVLRYAAARTLNRVAMAHPAAVTGCNIDMEALIADPNRSIATLAITTLLKTGAESSVERLMKQIQNFLSEIQDENKIVVVEAVRSLCLKYPAKHRTLMAFLSAILREEGGFEYKKAIVDAILTLIRDIPEAKEAGLGHLCEFIEDCEFTYLSSQVLHVLGNEGPHTAEPAKYIRYIYNRVILENATVRASAVSALAKFGAGAPKLRPRVVVLLRRCLHDNDDEVRDRATFYLSVLGAAAAADAAASAGDATGDAAADADADADAPPPPPPPPPALARATGLLVEGAGLGASVPALEAALRAYLSGATDKPFSLAGVPLEGSDAAAAAAAKAGVKPPAGAAGAGGGRAAASKSAAAAAAAADAAAHRAPGAAEAAALLNAIPAFAAFGPLFKSSAPLQLTEEETEYKVACTKHVFARHVVFQFACQNTIKEQVLEGVTVGMTPDDPDAFSEVAVIPLPTMPLARAGSTFVALRAGDGAAAALAKFTCVLRFTVKEVDPGTGEPEADGYTDEYSLEDCDVTPLDYIARAPVGNFRKAWEELPAESERTDDYGLGPRDGLAEALEAVLGTLGMAACEGSDAVPGNARSHTALLSGTFVGGVPVLVRLQLGMDAASNVAMKLCVRAADGDVSDIIHQIIAEA
jgi:coatomer protein complex subunit gamma